MTSESDENCSKHDKGIEKYLNRGSLFFQTILKTQYLS